MVHFFVEAGMEEGEFAEAREGTEEIKKRYEELAIKPNQSNENDESGVE